jgi:GTP-binding protein
MRIKKAEFIKSAVLPEDWPQDAYPHIALVGRSNVGKSSLINCVANNFKLARTSNVPGKTRLLNFYLFNGSFYVVDLPGYGYAYVSGNEKDKWGAMIESYLKGAANLVLIVQIVDIRHKPTADDIQMRDWINHFGFKTAVVASKIDKLSRSDVNQGMKDIKDSLRLGSDVNIIPFSSRTGQGREDLLSLMAPLLPD